MQHHCSDVVSLGALVLVRGDSRGVLCGDEDGVCACHLYGLLQTSALRPQDARMPQPSSSGETLSESHLEHFEVGTESVTSLRL